MLEQRIHELNVEFHDHVARHAETVGRYFDVASEAMHEVWAADMLPKGDRLPVPPPIVPREVARQLTVHHNAFRAALTHIFRGRMGGSWSALADELRLDEQTRRFLRTSRPPTWARVGRPDVVLSGDQFSMVEPNVGTSCGAMPDADVLGRIFEQSPVIGDYLRGIGAHRQDGIALMARLIADRMSADGMPADSLVVVIERRVELADPSFYHCDLFAKELRRYGLRSTAAPVEDLTIDTDRVSLAGERVSAVYRICGEQPDPEAIHPALAPLIDVAEMGAVSMIDPVGDQIAGNKTILAALSEELDAGRLPSRVAAELHGFVPWTRVLADAKAQVGSRQVDLLPWCESNRENLVLKPGSGFQGRGVLLGCEADDTRWREALHDALVSGEAWLVQQLVRTEPTAISISRNQSLASESTFVDYGYYVIGDVVAASMIRKSAPFGTFSRRIKPPVYGPVFFV